MARIVGFHFIFAAYGFWLPNDPRGSWSQTVRAFHLLRFGPATKVTTTRSVAGRAHDVEVRLAAKAALVRPAVSFSGVQARAISRGLALAAHEGGYSVRALAVLPDHVHLVMQWHTRPIDEIARHLKARATMQLSNEGLHPFGHLQRFPSPWGRNFWCPFLRDARHLATAVRYVEANPVKSGLPRQRWRWVERVRADMEVGA
jgi:REP element-mobilizing transposase RayT